MNRAVRTATVSQAESHAMVTPGRPQSEMEGILRSYCSRPI